MNDLEKARNERNRKLDIVKNKILVKILNHKMFKGYRDIKASKWFFNQKPKYISQLAWEDKIFDPFDDLYNLNYKMNVLPKKNPTFKNLLFIKNYPPKEKRVVSQKDKDKNRPKTSFHSNYSSNKNLSAVENLTKNKKYLRSKKNNFYLTSMSVYETDNFYHERIPFQVYQKIFENDKVIYNDIPLLSLDKVKNFKQQKLKKNKNHSKSQKNTNNSKNEIIQSSNNLYDIYDGLTEKQFLYKISHNRTNKNIDEKISINAFRKNKGIVKGFVSKRLQSARPIQKFDMVTFNKKKSEPKDITIELEYDNSGNLKTKKIYSTNVNNLKEEIINGNNNYLIYNLENNLDTDQTSNKRRANSSGYRETKTEDLIFGNPFKNFGSNKKNNLYPPLKYFQNKPRIFDDKLLLQFQLDKKNQFLKLKKMIE